MFDPKPCIFCGNTLLDLKAVVFRLWNIHCPSCGAKGPDGDDPDLAIINWNSYHNLSLQRRKILDMPDETPSTHTLWKAIRAMRTFTVSDLAMITGVHRETAYKYAYLLEKADYLRLETKKKKPGAPNVYRCIRPKQVEPPTWTRLRYKRIDEAMTREHIKKLKPVRVKAKEEA